MKVLTAKKVSSLETPLAACGNETLDSQYFHANLVSRPMQIHSAWRCCVLYSQYIQKVLMKQWGGALGKYNKFGVSNMGMDCVQTQIWVLTLQHFRTAQSNQDAKPPSSFYIMDLDRRTLLPYTSESCEGRNNLMAYDPNKIPPVSGWSSMSIVPSRPLRIQQGRGFVIDRKIS